MNHPCYAVVIDINKDRRILYICNCADDYFRLFRKPGFPIVHIYSNTSRILALTFILPPVGSAITLPQTRQFISLAAFPKTICSFLHFGHLTFMNLEVGSLVNDIMISSYGFYSL